jgi:hypothetical protein
MLAIGSELVEQQRVIQTRLPSSIILPIMLRVRDSLSPPVHTSTRHTISGENILDVNGYMLSEVSAGTSVQYIPVTCTAGH